MADAKAPPDPPGTGSRWKFQWEAVSNELLWIFQDWIAPNTLEGLRGKLVLDAGCGRGDQIRHVAPYAARVVGVDLNTSEVAQRQTADLPNVELHAGDIAVWDDGRRFDVVYSVGVVHHTDDPDRTAAHLGDLVKPGGRLIFWVYSHEGNWMNRVLLEGAKSRFLNKLPRSVLLRLSTLTTAALYPVVWTLYLLPLKGLPFYEYFANFRKFSFARNRMNVFDKMNAPKTEFITEARVRSWLPEEKFKDVHVGLYKGVSWCASGTKI